MERDELVYKISNLICDFLIKKQLCEENGCDNCIKKYCKNVLDFLD